ncbi:hypothetical protein D3C76_1062070 [compost metagenome]
MQGRQLVQLPDRLFDGQALTINGLVGTTQGVNHLVAEAATTHAFEVHAAGLGRAAEHRDERRNILANGRAHAGKRMRTNVAVLVDQGVARQDRPVPHVHMAGQRRVVDQDAMIANDTVVTDVRIGHDQVVVTDRGFRTVLHGATVNGHAFADHIVIADHQTRRFTLVLEVRGVFADRGKLVDAVVPADAGRALEHHMRADDRALPDLDIGAYDRPRADLDAIGQFGRGIDDGPRINQIHRERSAQVICAEQTGLPSTRARHSNFQIMLLRLRNLASSTSWSPGRTG